VENTIRPFAVGSQKWLFSDQPEGTRARAALNGLIERTKHNELNPNAYVTFMLQELPCASEDAAIDAFLPWKADPRIMDPVMVRRAP
jgi:transposase